MTIPADERRERERRRYVIKTSAFSHVQRVLAALSSGSPTYRDHRFTVPASNGWRWRMRSPLNTLM
jgi:hypothetical protein